MNRTMASWSIAATVIPDAPRAGSADGPVRRPGQACLGSVGVEVGEERLDVLRTIRRLVVQRERVLPYVHHDDRVESGDVAVFVQRDPVVAEPPGCGVQVGHRA